MKGRNEKKNKKFLDAVINEEVDILENVKICKGKTKIPEEKDLIRKAFGNHFFFSLLT